MKTVQMEIGVPLLSNTCGSWDSLKAFLEEQGVRLHNICSTEASFYFELMIQARPGVKKARLQILDDGSLKINLMAKPVDGAANRAIVQLLSKSLGISKSDVELLKGDKSKQKRIGMIFRCTDGKAVGYYMDRWKLFLGK